MSLTTSEMTPADIRACTCGNDGYGNGDGMWGNNAWWIVILLLFGWGRNGFGGFGGGYGTACQGHCPHRKSVSKRFPSFWIILSHGAGFYKRAFLLPGLP